MEMALAFCSGACRKSPNSCLSRNGDKCPRQEKGLLFGLYFKRSRVKVAGPGPVEPGPFLSFFASDADKSSSLWPNFQRKRRAVLAMAKA